MINKKITLDENFTEQDLVQAPDSYFLEIKAFNCLENSNNHELLGILCNKLKKGGSLILSGIDGQEICRRVYFGEIELKAAFNNILSKINSINYLTNLNEYFITNGWKINFSGLKDDCYLIEVVKP